MWHSLPDVGKVAPMGHSAQPRAAAAGGHRATLSWGVFIASERKGSSTEGFAAPSQGIQVPFFSLSDFPNAPPCSEKAAWEFNSFKSVPKSNGQSLIPCC